MAFSNATSRPKVTNFDEKKEKQMLENHIAMLHTDIDRESSRRSSIETSEEECAEAAKQVAVFLEHLTALKILVEEKKIVLVSLEENVESLETKTDTLEVALAEKTASADEAKVLLESIEQRIYSQQNEIEKLESTGTRLKTAIDKKNKAIAALELQYTKDLETFRSDLAITSSKELSEAKLKIDQLNDEESKLTSHVASLERTSAELSKSILSKELKSLDLIKALEKARVDLELAQESSVELIATSKSQAESQVEKILADGIEANKKRLSELTLREGIASKKESWYNEKVTRLIEIHAELEKFHGKNIPIVFPR